MLGSTFLSEWKEPQSPPVFTDSSHQNGDSCLISPRARSADCQFQHRYNPAQTAAPAGIGLADVSLSLRAISSYRNGDLTVQLRLCRCKFLFQYHPLHHPFLAIQGISFV
ncbi:hypothetical protein AGOR_G00240540 [Albula goreensis]|uniref:Uncharacterized protein n=1 Tax=Albula goreensis TaxID=1534307 RepID=A0A8T3CGA9_9TELE|nr:hypothetical protein AGOR_G00240540 [Albula goreensis]